MVPLLETNLIQKCLEKQLDTEIYAKFQQVLDYLSESLYVPLYRGYNEHLMAELEAMPGYDPSFPNGYSMEQHINLKIKFYAFRFISNVGQYLVGQHAKGDERAEEKFITLIKVLLHHGLTSKSDTANLALVELEQLCHAYQVTLPALYQKYPDKFLRSIIKAILQKLMTNGNSDSGNGSGNGNGSGWMKKSNCVIAYMTRAFEIFNVVSINSDDIARSLIITTNLIHKEKYDDAIKLFLEYLAKYQNIDICTLIRTHIQAIMVSLLLRRNLSHFDMMASLNKLCLFCGKSPSEILATKFTFIKGRLLLHYSVDAKIVKDAIYYLSKFEKEEHEQPFEDEFDDENAFIDYLQPSMIGILLGVDAHFTLYRRDLGSEESIKHIESLVQLVSLLDESKVQAIHVKLLSTLSLLLRLRPVRNNMNLNRALKNLWSIFLSKLTQESKVSLVINICVALHDLLEDCPEEVASIYNDLLCTNESKTLTDKLRCLFFIPDVPALKTIYSYLSAFVRRENCVSSLQELQQTLDGVLPLMKFESQKCHLIALTRIRQLLRSNQHLLISNMLLNQDEPLDSLISKTIESLLALSSTQDPGCSDLIAECLGILGAVNPIRLDHLIYGGIADKKVVGVANMSETTFVVDLVERLKNSLFSDQRSESEIANYALQVVVKIYNVFGNANIKGKLSEEAIKACQLCQNTNYIGARRSPPDLSASVYEKFKNENQYSYKEWLDKFSLVLISCLANSEIQEVLHACSYIFRHNLKLAEFLLPNAIIHVVLNQSSKISIIKREILSIVDEDVGVSTQDLDTVYTEDVRGNIQTLHFQCANMIFCALDALNRLECDAKGPKPSVSLIAKQFDQLRDFNQSIPKDKLAILASKCRAHTRALCYFEQYLFDNKSQIDKYSTALQKIYIALDDSYEAAGIEMIRNSPTTITDDIANYESSGRFDKAFICYNTSIEAMGDCIEKENFIEDSLKCLSSQGDQQRLYEKSKQLLAEFPQFKRSILPAAIEACWKLGRWDELDITFKNEQFESLLESAPVSQGYLLTSFSESRKDTYGKLKIVRDRLMKPLSIAMMDRSAYFRGYQNLSVLHGIEDFALALNVLESSQIETQQVDENTIDSVRLTMEQKLDSLFELWRKRNKLVQPSLRNLEPLLAWQRSISLALSRKYPFMQSKIDVDVGRMWLASADSAREARSFERSFFCLTQAQRWFGSEFHKLGLNLRVKYTIEHAKLDWDQGEQTKAIRGLKLSLQQLKDHHLYQHLEARKNSIIVTRTTKELPAKDPFPQLNDMRPCSECSTFDKSERESFAQLKMLLTRYSEEAAAGIPETLLYMYEECVHLGVNQEETYFRLARYYDKLLTYYMENPKLCVEQSESSHYDATQRFSQNIMSGDRDDVYTKLMEHSIIAFGNSLKYGVRYLGESMPRMLNIWYDLGTKKCSHATPLRSISSRIESTVRFIDDLKKCLPSYYFMSAISLILSRVCHPHSGVSKKTCEILELLLSQYPHQMTWQMIAMWNDENDDRKRAAKQIIDRIRRKDPKIDKVVRDTVDFSRVIVELCSAHGPYDKRDNDKKKKLQGIVSLKEISSQVTKFDFSKIRVIAPVQASIRAILPTENISDSLGAHAVFPEHNVSYVRAFESKARIFNSLQQPRQVSLKCDNGRTVHILCKAGDDLRKDSRCIEFFNLLNRVLRKDGQANARFFEIPTFLVLPLQSAAGIIEMVPNCETLRTIVDRLYKERKHNFAIHDAIPKRQRNDVPPAEVYQVFVKNVLPKVSPPVLQNFFLRKFTEPTSWYMARLAFVRSTAVISMGGYIIGLGDRHLDNILVDVCNGRVIHVDFNLLFHQGETLPCPETVPFRLTQNVVAAFGPMGTEGNFRKFCEIAMRVMRKEKDALLTTLKPFMHDPCSEWIKSRVRDTRGAARNEPEDKHAENKSAKFRIEVVERKLKGFPRSRKFKPLTLFDSYSVEAQVDNLIEEASDLFNLAQMYYGWAPHI